MNIDNNDIKQRCTDKLRPPRIPPPIQFMILGSTYDMIFYDFQI